MGGICSSCSLSNEHILKPIWLDYYNPIPNKYIITHPKLAPHLNNPSSDLLSPECDPSALNVLETKYLSQNIKLYTNY